MMSNMAALGLAVVSLLGRGLEVAGALRGRHAGLTSADVCRELILDHEYAERTRFQIQSENGNIPPGARDLVQRAWNEDPERRARRAPARPL